MNSSQIEENSQTGQPQRSVYTKTHSALGILSIPTLNTMLFYGACLYLSPEKISFETSAFMLFNLLVLLVHTIFLGVSVAVISYSRNISKNGNFRDARWMHIYICSFISSVFFFSLYGLFILDRFQILKEGLKQENVPLAQKIVDYYTGAKVFGGLLSIFSTVFLFSALCAYFFICFGTSEISGLLTTQMSLFGLVGFCIVFTLICFISGFVLLHGKERSAETDREKLRALTYLLSSGCILLYCGVMQQLATLNLRYRQKALGTGTRSRKKRGSLFAVLSMSLAIGVCQIVMVYTESKITV